MKGNTIRNGLLIRLHKDTGTQSMDHPHIAFRLHPLEHVDLPLSSTVVRRVNFCWNRVSMHPSFTPIKLLNLVKVSNASRDFVYSLQGKAKDGKTKHPPWSRTDLCRRMGGRQKHPSTSLSKTLCVHRTAPKRVSYFKC